MCVLPKAPGILYAAPQGSWDPLCFSPRLLGSPRLLPETPWNCLKEVGLLCVCSAVHLGTQVGSLSSVFAFLVIVHLYLYFLCSGNGASVAFCIQAVFTRTGPCICSSLMSEPE